MKKYENINVPIAALSPCVAKAYEFENTRLIDYNVTIARLNEYIAERNIMFPTEPSGFDHFVSGLGSLFPMPGGLKENVEYYLGKSIRIDKSEGPRTVYGDLDEYAEQPPSKLPVIYDVLNCQDGCNKGTGCTTEISIFDINTSMDKARQESLNANNLQYLEELYQRFDDTLDLNDFLRTYSANYQAPISITQADIDRAFEELGKFDDESRTFDCSACGCNTCLEMAIRIAKGVNTTENCAEKAKLDFHEKEKESMALQSTNLVNIDTILNDTSLIKEMTEGMVTSIDEITEAISVYNSMIRDIEKIAMQVNIIALNASIEAARAGKHGKAFNVVAEEIRTLAQSSSNSADQTKEASAKATKAIGTVNDMILKISDNVNTAYDNISEISENTKKILTK